MGDVPNADAQRRLAGLTLDPSRDVTLRRQSATQLLRSIRRFGRLITADQEAQLIASIRETANPDVRTDLLTILNALRPAPTAR